MTARACDHCGTEFTAKTAKARFCSPKCKKAWHNLQMVRGRELYSLYMASRFDRTRWSGAISQVNRLCSQWHKEDQGRRTWDDPAAFLAANPWLLPDAKVSNMSIGRNPR